MIKDIKYEIHVNSKFYYFINKNSSYNVVIKIYYLYASVSIY